MIRTAEIALPRLENVELGAFLEVLDDLWPIRRLQFVHGLRHDLGGDIVAPGLVLGWLVVLLGEGADEGLGAGRVDQMMPDRRPGAYEVALSGGPGQRRIEAEASDREGQAELGILLEEVGYLVAGKVDYDEVGFGLADLKEISGKVGGVRRDQIVTGEIATIRLHEPLRNLQEVMTEGVIGRQRIPLLALDQTVAQEGTADSFHVHGILRFDVEHIALAILAAERVRVAASVYEESFGARRHLSNRQAGRGGDLTNNASDLVALDHSFGLGGRRLR